MANRETSNLIDSFVFLPTDVRKILLEFKKPLFQNTFFRNIELLKEESNLVKFDNSKWIMRPTHFCNDYYGEQYLFPVILLVNNIKTFFDFRPENFYNQIIIAPKIEKIVSVLKYSV